MTSGAARRMKGVRPRRPSVIVDPRKGRCFSPTPVARKVGKVGRSRRCAKIRLLALKTAATVAAKPKLLPVAARRMAAAMPTRRAVAVIPATLKAGLTPLRAGTTRSRGGSATKEKRRRVNGIAVIDPAAANVGVIGAANVAVAAVSDDEY